MRLDFKKLTGRIVDFGGRVKRLFDVREESFRKVVDYGKGVKHDPKKFVSGLLERTKRFFGREDVQLFLGKGGRIKRLFDFTVASTALLLLWPALLTVAVLVRIKLGSPVLFRQTRPGLHGKPFEILKFRTMRDAFGPDGEPLPDCDRLTSFGRLLRSTSLDELPELWNVVKGEMSIVGPRPLLMQYLDRYTSYQARRHDVRPGITGWAQVNGRNAITWEEKFDLDVWYIDNQSVILDLKIMWMTVGSVVGRDDVCQPGHATMEEFMGSEDRDK